VKKSEKPWAVLRSSPWAIPELPFLMHALIRSTAPDLQTAIHSAFAKGCVISANKWFGHGVHAVFKKPDEHGRWFKAAAKTCRASISETQRPLRELMGDPWMVEYVQPLVVLDGKLLAVALDAKGEMLLEDIPFASVQFEERDRETRKAFVIDLVTLDALPAYVDRIESGFDHCFQLLAEHRT
jgi:hypothetical protein